MSFSSQTPSFKLPQFMGNDKAVWTDLNPAFLTIDQQMQANKVAASNASASSATAGTTAAAAQTTANSAMTEIEGIKSALAEINQSLSSTAVTIDARANVVFGAGVTPNSGASNGGVVRRFGNVLDLYLNLTLSDWDSLTAANTIPDLASIDPSYKLIESFDASLGVRQDTIIFFTTTATYHPASSEHGVFIIGLMLYQHGTKCYIMAYRAAGTGATNIRVLTRVLAMQSNGYPPLPKSLYPTPLTVNFNDPVQDITVQHADNVDVQNVGQ